MHEVLVVSDSHGLTKELTEIKERHSPEYMIHCGDSELGIEALALDGFVKVAGNCDRDSRLPIEQTLTIDGLTLYIVHGHLHYVKKDLTRLSYRAEEVGAHIVCFGHTHVAGVWSIHNQVFVNPGSIYMPRGYEERTYAIISWDQPDHIHVRYYTVDGKRVPHLDQTVQLESFS
ncbi:MAG TPA: metallophosphoesterase [Bacillota bacterium]|nr:metallophosphoesterase [Bacillota bacterium]